MYLCIETVNIYRRSGKPLARHWYSHVCIYACICVFQTVNESVPEVREASYQALGTAMKVIGEKHILPFLTDVDQMKMAKVSTA